MSARRTWYHTIDLPDGTATPGWFDTRAAPRHVPWPDRVRGGRCLDVGTFDGFWAFELEKRGAAEVVALDVDDATSLDWPYDRRASGPALVAEWGTARGPGFVEAATRIGSSARRYVKSVYDLDPAEDGTFDVVLCGSLLLHLRDPVLALERMREVCRGALVLVEAVDPTLDLLAPRVAAGHLYPQHDEWWRLNSAGLARILHLAGFRVTATGPRFVIPKGPGAPRDHKLSPLAGIAARRPGRRGLLTRAFVAEPRPPADARQ